MNPSKVNWGGNEFVKKEDGTSLLMKLKFDKVLKDLTEIFVNLSRSELVNYIEAAQHSTDFNFSNDSLQQVMCHIIDAICSDQSTKESKKSQTKPPSSSKPQFTTDCTICQESLQNMKVLKLRCSHRFHEKCIIRWVKEQSTCPICRKFTLLEEDFPPLC
ncbi:hypothetical protein HELRODRAFT_188288 [Helobdella robusta]|uniref:RING-type domain-containing protein n=1 Tax=Helobdella robusta TaxID=6412 RepID=T1FPU1_HELRO|nr:hypothetical protein HELRODRAFT_188288 [Helobdella robusta]ESO06177.1 hypothetical protein HELRODRAFT_188288 [Helobdella robusta]